MQILLLLLAPTGQSLVITVIILVRSFSDEMEKILSKMMDTMNSVKPPRMTALRELHEAETGGPFSILIGTILSARTKDESTTKVVKVTFFKIQKSKRTC